MMAKCGMSKVETQLAMSNGMRVTARNLPKTTAPAMSTSTMHEVRSVS